MKWILILGLVVVAEGIAHAQTPTPTPGPQSTVVISYASAKDPFVIAARDAYNARTGSALTTLQYAKEVLREGIVAELTLLQQKNANATIAANDATAAATDITTRVAVQTYNATQLVGW